jgi:hypothetical protein
MFLTQYSGEKLVKAKDDVYGFLYGYVYYIDTLTYIYTQLLPTHVSRKKAVRNIWPSDQANYGLFVVLYKGKAA